jgi:hypothetical protein
MSTYFGMDAGSFAIFKFNFQFPLLRIAKFAFGMLKYQLQLCRRRNLFRRLKTGKALDPESFNGARDTACRNKSASFATALQVIRFTHQ